jgi:hypothetical protein
MGAAYLVILLSFYCDHMQFLFERDCGNVICYCGEGLEVALARYIIVSFVVDFLLSVVV